MWSKFQKLKPGGGGDTTWRTRLCLGSLKKGRAMIRACGEGRRDILKSLSRTGHAFSESGGAVEEVTMRKIEKGYAGGLEGGGKG